MLKILITIFSFLFLDKHDLYIIIKRKNEKNVFVIRFIIIIIIIIKPTHTKNDKKNKFLIYFTFTAIQQNSSKKYNKKNDETDQIRK